jgi:hypothetical protein
LDGQRQRRAFDAAELAIVALGERNPGGARRAAARAEELDQLGLYVAFRQLVDRAAADLQAGGEVTPRLWTALGDAVGPGPLRTMIEDLAGR